jgi:hypothetical protein
MKTYLATWLEEPGQAVALNNKGALNRLLSYYFLGKRPKINEEIRDYVKNENIFCGSSGSNRKRKKMV